MLRISIVTFFFHCFDQTLHIVAYFVQEQLFLYDFDKSVFYQFFTLNDISAIFGISHSELDAVHWGCLICYDTCRSSSVLWGSITFLPTVRNNLRIVSLPNMPKNAVWVGSSTGHCSLPGALLSVDRVGVRPVTVRVSLNIDVSTQINTDPPHSTVRLTRSEKMAHRRLVCFL